MIQYVTFHFTINSGAHW